MAQDVVGKTSEQEEVESKKLKDKLDNLLKIKDINDEVIYTSSLEEFEEVLDAILSAGEYVKTFKLFKGKIELTYKTIIENEQQLGYAYIREYFTKNKNLSGIEQDSFMSKVNIAQQLVRITIGGVSTPVSNGTLDDRMKLLSELPGDTLRLTSKYLSIFANITTRAFNSEDILKN